MTTKVDFLCLPSINGEIPIEVSPGTIAIPPELRGRKVNVDSLAARHEGRIVKFDVQSNGDSFCLDWTHDREFIIAGSAVNDAVGLAKLGSKVAISGAIGDDSWGGLLQSHIRQFGILDLCFERFTRTPVTISLIEREGGSTLFCFKPPYTLEMSRALECLKRADPRYIVATGVRKSEVELIATLFAESSDKKHVFVPSGELCQSPISPELQRVLSHTDILQVNCEEALSLLGENVSAEEAADRLANLGPKVAIVRLAARGSVAAAFHNGERGILTQDALAADVVDTTGAGDGFLVGFLWADAKGLSHKQCLEAGSWVAARNIEAIGGHGGMPTLEAFTETFPS